MILLVDDSEAMRRVIKSFVRDLTEAITECSDGSEAIETYERCHPDWVLMDIKMKEVDGLVATKQIKAAFPEARIIIITGYDDARLREAAYNAGACAYVHKENLLELRRILTG
jgi:CheY-like chemotaxis protein